MSLKWALGCYRLRSLLNMYSRCKHAVKWALSMPYNQLWCLSRFEHIKYKILTTVFRLPIWKCNYRASFYMPLNYGTTSMSFELDLLGSWFMNWWYYIVFRNSLVVKETAIELVCDMYTKHWCMELLVASRRRKICVK